METFGRVQLFIRTHKSDFGMFVLRIALTFVFIAHSASILMDILPSSLSTILDIKEFIFAILELICGIMLLSGFLINIASYTMALMMIYFLIFEREYLGILILDKNNAYAYLVIASLIAIMLIGPGKFVLNKRYGHIAGSMREEGIDKEVEIMGT